MPKDKPTCKQRGNCSQVGIIKKVDSFLLKRDRGERKKLFVVYPFMAKNGPDVQITLFFPSAAFEQALLSLQNRKKLNAN